MEEVTFGLCLEGCQHFELIGWEMKKPTSWFF